MDNPEPEAEIKIQFLKSELKVFLEEFNMFFTRQEKKIMNEQY